MAGNRIRVITVEIGSDTTKLQTALKGVNTEIRNTQSQLAVAVWNGIRTIISTVLNGIRGTVNSV